MKCLAKIFIIYWAIKLIIFLFYFQIQILNCGYRYCFGSAFRSDGQQYKSSLDIDLLLCFTGS